jgi:hypothetical protein
LKRKIAEPTLGASFLGVTCKLFPKWPGGKKNCLLVVSMGIEDLAVVSYENGTRSGVKREREEKERLVWEVGGRRSSDDVLYLSPSIPVRQTLTIVKGFDFAKALSTAKYRTYK